ncbi:MAG: stimulus-sensing domain-containing protein [Methylobacteriaceae bacterium]|jgi:two-component system sensor histidine kinase ChvG|uniref:histidine kinase n=2 Tax=Methylorubrum extorquens TaxID=408 RepID=A0A1S1P2G4_METEX|nr:MULTISPECIES: sensor histidine kinase [Methylorubrum]KQO91338.1 histidine kinase [Methylobacterium sp. Leaf90]KQP88756.1 histidine kinase [Methylobacterium sp. Leaf119]MDF9861434.1 two-component system sensor histidine kinase ChvG [Methylorubrum pseudosasae]MDH6635060.1 two-component system sensor histidine kinase ChvG [Methylobacterium sp. SuP10 SLI 274]ABY29639.1 ATP-binding region ATPase domain protein [Methylorubrum extorquens PA1]
MLAPLSRQPDSDEVHARRGVLARLVGSLTRPPLTWPRALWNAVGQRASSSLTRRIVVLNLVGLIVLLFGFLYLNQFRQGLIQARVQSLLIQGDIIAGAIAAQASVDTDTIRVDPDKLLQQQAGEGREFDDDPASLAFSLNPEKVAPLLRRLVTPTGNRARVYDSEGSLLFDTRTLYARGDIGRSEAVVKPPKPNVLERIWDFVGTRILGLVVSERSAQEEAGPQDGRAFREVQAALKGSRGTISRRNERGETIVSVAVPIQRAGSVRGVLMVSTQGGDIDRVIASERFGLLQVFLVAAAVMLVLSILLAGAIAGPVRRLADAAERVRRGIKSRQEIPDFTSRTDEIGHLSGALRDMTQALYRRLDAIESFAADVSHELKNPLTSLRSAVETLPLAKTDESRGRLMQIIQHDVKRLDRLISDISDASRLDAELARAEARRVDLGKLLTTVTSVANERRRAKAAVIQFDIERPSGEIEDPFRIIGHDSRLGQVVNNLLDNARSFSPPGAKVRVALRRLKNEVEFVVEDEGPGIPEHALERIFERFYTDRPEQGFGQNSGLGLSISRQIIQAHHGSIRAENRPGPADEEGHPTVRGARFIVRLPVAPRADRYRDDDLAA